MKIYHGSYVEVSIPDVHHSRKNVDFGQGFYVTPLKDQAVQWSMRFKRHQQKAVVTSYDFDEIECRKNYKILEFASYSREWLEYIVNCRRGQCIEEADVVIGGVANDKVFNTIELYFEGLIEQDEAIKRLRYEKPNLQMCIRNQKIIEQHLRFVESEEI